MIDRQKKTQQEQQQLENLEADEVIQDSVL